MATRVKSIPIGGITNSHSDFISNDGDLEAAINVVHDGVAIMSTPQSAAKKVYSFHDGEIAIYRHENNNFHHIITKTIDKKYKAYSEENDTLVEIEDYSGFDKLDGKDINTITGVGNVLVIYTNDDPYYIRWNGVRYEFVSNNLPLLSDIRVYQNIGIDAKKSTNIPSGKIIGTLDSPIIMEDISDYVFSAINGMITEGNKDGKIYFPYLVSICYELYDGSFSAITNPILMMPCAPHQKGYNEAVCPCCYIEGTTNLMAYGVYGIPQIHIELTDDEKQQLRGLKDIVKKIVMFVSLPIYGYDPSGKCSHVITRSSFGYKADICTGVYGSGIGVHQNIAPYTFENIYARWYSTKTIDAINMFETNLKMVKLPEITTSIQSRIESTGTLYKLKSYMLDDVIDGNFTKIEDFDKGTLENLSLKETLSTDYASTDKLVAEYATTYNNRLSVARTKRYPLEWFSMNRYFPYTNKNLNAVQYTSSVGDVINPDDKVYFQMKIVLRNDGKEYTIYSGKEQLPFDFYTRYMYYPNPNVERIEIYSTKNGTYANYIEAKPKTHGMLDGSVFVDLEEELHRTSQNIPIVEKFDTGNCFEDRNVIYTSEVNNPFVFKAANIEQVGNGSIIALVPQAVALSQGQFGQYPMTCFTTDGIWALSVSDTGGWLAKQPISRDVVLNNDAGNILQLDRQILFSSNRGLMMMSGSNVECISEMLNGTNERNDSNENCFDFLKSKITGKNLLDVPAESFINPEFKKFIGDAVFLYDYTHQRIFIGNPSYNFAFVYSMNDKAWTSIPLCIKSAVNSYPECYANIEPSNGSKFKEEKDQDESMLSAPHAELVESARNSIRIKVGFDQMFANGDVVRVYVSRKSKDDLTPTSPQYNKDATHLIDYGSTIYIMYSLNGVFSNKLSVTATQNNILVDFSRSNMPAFYSIEEDARHDAEIISMPHDGFILTRPIKLDDASSRKVIRTINVQGKFKKQNVDIILLGCSDNAMSNWFILASCKGSRLPFKYGTPFKYFRIALITKLWATESISSITIEYSVKELDKLHQ